jgi:hypothetical protein
MKINQELTGWVGTCVDAAFDVEVAGVGDAEILAQDAAGRAEGDGFRAEVGGFVGVAAGADY